MEPTKEPLLRFAVTTILLTTAGATACQISLVPFCVFDRSRRLQVKPPPVTDENDCRVPALPSDMMKARMSSPG